MHEFLNHMFRPCREQAATFSERERAVALFDITTQAKIEGLITKKQPRRIGEGLPGEKVLLGRTEERFLWNISGFWENTSQSRSIQILPNCDRKDAETWIEAFSPIDKKILRRGLADRKPVTFVLGPRFDKEYENVGFANAETRQIGFSQSRNGENLLCTLVEEATADSDKPIPLQMLILHEIGHLLETQLEKPLGELIGSFPENHTKAGVLLDQISPQYLSEDWGACTRLFEILKEKSARGETTVQVKGWNAPTPLASFEKNRRTEFCREILAELVRTIYLEPALSNKVPTPVETGWSELDDLANRIEQEAQYNLKKGALERSPFPQRITGKTNLGSELEP